MKCDELKSYVCGGWCCSEESYHKNDVDEAIAELKAYNESLKEMMPKYDQFIKDEKFKKKLVDEYDGYVYEWMGHKYIATPYINVFIKGILRALWLARAERYKMKEFIAREEANLRDQMAWSQYLRERTYSQWVDQLLRIANLANKLQNKCRAKAEEYK